MSPGPTTACHPTVTGRACRWLICVAMSLQISLGAAAPPVAARPGASPATHTRPLQFTASAAHAPFPYDGPNPETGRPFFDRIDPVSGARLHTNRYGQQFAEAASYRDPTVEFFVPAGFAPDRPITLVCYLHSHDNTAQSCLDRQQVREQVAAAGLNAILITPQLARNAIDSSPGKWFQPGVFRRFIDEAADLLADRLGTVPRRVLRRAPLVLIAFSGGYKATAYILDRGQVADRIRGVLLLDALYENVDEFHRWLRQYCQQAFFVSVHSPGSCERNAQKLAQYLTNENLPHRHGWPKRLGPGAIHFVKVTTEHLQVPRRGPPARPIAALLRLLTNP